MRTHYFTKPGNRTCTETVISVMSTITGFCIKAFYCVKIVFHLEIEAKDREKNKRQRDKKMCNLRRLERERIQQSQSNLKG